jgi:hypothetical protein
MENPDREIDGFLIVESTTCVTYRRFWSSESSKKVAIAIRIVKGFVNAVGVKDRQKSKGNSKRKFASRMTAKRVRVD